MPERKLFARARLSAALFFYRYTTHGRTRSVRFFFLPQSSLRKAGNLCVLGGELKAQLMAAHGIVSWGGGAGKLIGFAGLFQDLLVQIWIGMEIRFA